MRSPDDKRAQVEKAVEAARERLYWVFNDPGRWIWKDSRWSGQDPKDDWEQCFHGAIEVVQKIINDPGCDDLLHKYAGGQREAIITALARARPQPRKKGQLRKQMNTLRDQWIAEAVALTCKDGTFSPTRNKDAKTTKERKESGCSIVAEALARLGIKRMGEKQVTSIWIMHKQAFRHLLFR